jgi:hypothetical protein
MATRTRLVVFVVCSITIPHRGVDSIQGWRPPSLVNLLGLCSYLLRGRTVRQLESQSVCSPAGTSLFSNCASCRLISFQAFRAYCLGSYIASRLSDSARVASIVSLRYESVRKGDSQALDIRVIPDCPGSLFSIINTPMLSNTSSQPLLIVLWSSSDHALSYN